MDRRRTTRRARSGARRRRRWLHERPLLLEMLWRPTSGHHWEALRMWRKRVVAEPPSERALRLTWRAWRGALPKMLCVMV